MLLDHMKELYLNRFFLASGYTILMYRIWSLLTIILMSGLFQSKIRSLAQGAIICYISKKEIIKLDVPVPSMQEQIEISKVLNLARNEAYFLPKKILPLFNNKKRSDAEITKQPIKSKSK
ncbi:MAG: hypothetical protein ACMUEM_02090 [Flavobacteriales bacterium AspAUS03]